MQLELRAATPKEHDEIIALYDSVAQWLTAKGLKQWEYPTPLVVVETAWEAIEEGNLIVAFAAGEKRIAAALRMAWQGAPLWPNETDAGYLYGMCLRPDLIGKKYGDQLLKWAQTEILSRGKTVFRLDCLSSNQFLHEYYKRQGFAYVQDSQDGDYVLSLYEKHLG